MRWAIAPVVVAVILIACTAAWADGPQLRLLSRDEMAQVRGGPWPKGQCLQTTVCHPCAQEGEVWVYAPEYIHACDGNPGWDCMDDSHIWWCDAWFYPNQNCTGTPTYTEDGWPADGCWPD